MDKFQFPASFFLILIDVLIWVCCRIPRQFCFLAYFEAVKAVCWFSAYHGR